MNPRTFVCVALAFAALGGSALLAQEGKGEAPPAAPAAPALLPWLENHEEAAKIAKERNVLILTDLYTDWCGWCKKLEQDTYPAPAVQAVLKDFVLLKINPEKTEFGKTLMTKAGARGFPATVITDADWNLVRFISGFKPADAYAEEVSAALKAYKEFKVLEQTVKDGKADYEGLYKFLKACDELSRKADIQAHGEKALAMEKGAHHADIAYFLSKTYDAGSPEFAKYKELTLKLDPENAFGHLDDYTLDEAIRTANASKKKEEAAANIEKAIGILEARVAAATPALHKEKGQTIFWVLFQLHMNGKKDAAKAKEMLTKGIAMNPDSTMGKHMADVLKKVGG